MSFSSEVEFLEAEAWAHMHLAWDAEVAGATTVKRWGRATGLLTPAVKAAAVNRVIGLGCATPLDRQRLAEIEAFYRAGGQTRWFLEWSPDARSTEADLLESAGGRIKDHQAKLFGMVADLELATENAGIHVISISRDDRYTFRDLIGPTLGIPEAGRAGVIAPVGQTGWHYYLALAEDTPIAGAAMFVNGEGAWLGLSATLPSHRQKGAQTALLSARIRDARLLGCEWVSAETYPTSAATNPSLRNMNRLGMQVLYRRPFYQFGDPT
jgi:GNAT superfamily N-acetyltransferase